MTPTSISVFAARFDARGLWACIAVGLLAFGLIVVLGGARSAAPALALLLGIGMRAALPARASAWARGAQFARNYLVRAAVVLIGFSVSAHSLAMLGWAAVWVDIVMLTSTLMVASAVGRLLKLDPTLAFLVGIGAAVCGTSAVMATQTVVSARTEQVTVAVATVVLGGVVCLVLYPTLWALAEHYGAISASGFARYIGSTVHEVPQVLALSGHITPSEIDTAVMTKMGRVAMLGPVLALVAARASEPGAEASPGLTPTAATSEQGDHTGARPSSARRAFHALRASAAFPALFMVSMGIGFAVPGVHSALPGLATAIQLLMCVALSGVGLSTSLLAVRNAGIAPAALGLVLLVWLIAFGALVNFWIGV